MEVQFHPAVLQHFLPNCTVEKPEFYCTVLSLWMSRKFTWSRSQLATRLNFEQLYTDKYHLNRKEETSYFCFSLWELVITLALF